MTSREQRIQAGAKQHVDLIHANLGNPEIIVQLTKMIGERGEPLQVEDLAAAGGWTLTEVQTELDRHPGLDWEDDGTSPASGSRFATPRMYIPSVTGSFTASAPATCCSSRSASARA